MVEPSMVEPYG